MKVLGSLSQFKLNKPYQDSELKSKKKLPFREEHLTFKKKVLACLFIVIRYDDNKIDHLFRDAVTRGVDHMAL